MPDMASDMVVQCTIDYRLDNQQNLLTWHYVYDQTTGVPPSIDDFSVALMGKFEELGELAGTFAACLSEDVSILNYTIQVIFPVRYRYRRFTPGVVAGTVAQDALPPNVAHVITMQADDTGRRFRGNKHIGGVPSTFSLNGFVTEAGRGALNSLGIELRTPLTGPGEDTEWRLDPIFFRNAVPVAEDFITSHYVQDTTRIMRRRTVGLGS